MSQWARNNPEAMEGIAKLPPAEQVDELAARAETRRGPVRAPDESFDDWRFRYRRWLHHEFDDGSDEAAF